MRTYQESNELLNSNIEQDPQDPSCWDMPSWVLLRDPDDGLTSSLLTYEEDYWFDKDSPF